jgi:hypothetical protein
MTTTIVLILSKLGPGIGNLALQIISDFGELGERGLEVFYDFNRQLACTSLRVDAQYAEFLAV